MIFNASLRGSKRITTYNSVAELPIDVQRKIKCSVWSECGFIGIDFNHLCGDYSQVMPCDKEALDWIKSNFIIN